MLTTSSRALSVRLCRRAESTVRCGQRPYRRPRLRCYAATSAAAPLSEELVSEREVTCRVLCPICLTTEFELGREKAPSSALRCHRCQRSFDATASFYDLTLSSGEKETEYTLANAVGTTTFQNPLVGYVYERGWRQNFASAGFPGPDREFESAMEFLQPVSGEAVMDLSCGSGLFTRRFLASGAFSTVVAVDYSAAMLTQTRQFINRMESPFEASLHLVRADVGRLPFPAGSFKAIFAGAAIHCWPNPAIGLAEISRLLSPGGVFVMSTFTQLPKEVDELLDRPLLRPLKSLLPQRRARLINYWDEQVLKDTCRLAGLENFQSIRNRLYIMARVNKPLS